MQILQNYQAHSKIAGMKTKTMTVGQLEMFAIKYSRKMGFAWSISVPTLGDICDKIGQLTGDLSLQITGLPQEVD